MFKELCEDCNRPTDASELKEARDSEDEEYPLLLMCLQCRNKHAKIIKQRNSDQAAELD